jgi:O-antigen ligase
MITCGQDRSKLNMATKKYAGFFMQLTPCTFLLPIPVTHLFLIVMASVWLYLSFSNSVKNKFRFKGNLVALLLLLYFGLQLLSLTYSNDLVEGFKNIETKLSILLFPLITFSGYDLLEGVDKRKVLLFFAHSTFAFCVFVMGKILVTNNNLQVIWNEYTFEKLSHVIDVHPGYFSLYICFAILILIVHFNSFSKFHRFLVTGQIIILGVFTFRLASRMPIIGLLICCSIFILLERRYVFLMVGIVLVGTFVFFTTINSPDVKERYVAPIKMLAAGNWDALGKYAFNRVQIYSCAIEILSGPTLLTGVGAGDVDNSLIKCYDAHDYWWVSRMRYNAHNEFLQTTIEVGIIGFLIFAILLSLPSRFWPLHKEFLMFSILFGVYSLTESTLQVQKGVIFFSFFYSLFASFAAKSKIVENEQ